MTHMQSLGEAGCIGRRSVEAILAEIGVEMRYWPTDEAIASWAKICPGNNKRGDKRRSTSIGRVWALAALAPLHQKPDWRPSMPFVAPSIPA